MIFYIACGRGELKLDIATFKWRREVSFTHCEVIAIELVVCCNKLTDLPFYTDQNSSSNRRRASIIKEFDLHFMHSQFDNKLLYLPTIAVFLTGLKRMDSEEACVTDAVQISVIIVGIVLFP